MHDQAGTVIGGITEVSLPDDPRSLSPEIVGSSSRHRSSTSDGSAQSSPMIMILEAAIGRGLDRRQLAGQEIVTVPDEAGVPVAS
jgi:hypothetical protein